jgi:hypothetical protein
MRGPLQWKKQKRLFGVALLISAVMTAQARAAQPRSEIKKSVQNTKAPRLIAKLIETPLPDIESGMPPKTFGKWFAEQAKPGMPHYVVKKCDAPGTERESKGPMCVVASVKVSRVRRLELTFALMEGERSSQNEKNPEVRPTTWRFLVGSLGPNDPRMKVPVHVITRLSELPPLVRQRHPAPPFVRIPS